LPFTIEQLLTGSSSSASTAAAVEALQEVQPVEVEDGVTSTLTSSGLTSLPAAPPRRSGWSHADSSILDKAEAAVKAAVITATITTAIRILLALLLVCTTLRNLLPTHWV
jgi:hypothetical protein